MEKWNRLVAVTVSYIRGNKKILKKEVIFLNVYFEAIFHSLSKAKNEFTLYFISISVDCNIIHSQFQDTVIEMVNKTSELLQMLVQLLIASVILFVLLSACYLLHCRSYLFSGSIGQRSPASGVDSDSVAAFNIMPMVFLSTRSNDDTHKENNPDEKEHGDEDDINLADLRNSENHLV